MDNPILGSMTLIVQSGLLSGTSRTYASGGAVLIGRDESCDLVVPDRGLSRRHCKLFFENGAWCLQDLGSTNGTYLNGRYISAAKGKTLSEAHLVYSGDEMTVGEATLEIRIESKRIEKTELLLPTQVSPEHKATAVFVPTTSEEKLGVVDNPMRRSRTILRQSTSRLPNHENSEIHSEQSGNSKHDGSRTPSVASEPDLFNQYLRNDTEGGNVAEEPRTFRNFRLVRKIGEGGMGEVFLAKDQQDAKLAIKFLTRNTEQTDADRLRFIREIEITSKLNHPALIRCTEFGEENGRMFFVMDYCNGGNLTELLERSGKLNLRRAVRLLDRLLSGLQQAHDREIVHRDLKPSNIILHREKDGKYLPKIGDFGLAKNYMQAGESGMTVNGTVGGSWNFMPVEQLTNFRFVTPASDIWSLAAIIYECLTLRQPRPILPNIDPIKTILESDVVPINEVIPDINEDFAALLMKSLSKDYKNRFQSATKMRAALAKVAKASGIPL